MDLPYLNDMNGASHITMDLCALLMRQPRDRPLVGAEFGCPYGGNVQRLGRLWKPAGGTVYGFDTFTGHPKQIAKSPDAFEATCMDLWYETIGRDGLDYDYQRRVLDEEGLANVILRKGLIDEHSLDAIPYLHYAMLDLDIVSAMRTAVALVLPKLLPGGLLCLHDAIPPGHIEGLYELYQEVRALQVWSSIAEFPQSYLVAMGKRL